MSSPAAMESVALRPLSPVQYGRASSGTAVAQGHRWISRHNRPCPRKRAASGCWGGATGMALTPGRADGNFRRFSAKILSPCLQVGGYGQDRSLGGGRCLRQAMLPRLANSSAREQRRARQHDYAARRSLNYRVMCLEPKSQTRACEA